MLFCVQKGLTRSKYVAINNYYSFRVKRFSWFLKTDSIDKLLHIEINNYRYRRTRLFQSYFHWKQISKKVSLDLESLQVWRVLVLEVLPISFSPPDTNSCMLVYHIYELLNLNWLKVNHVLGWYIIL